jgi:fluoroacetyl-CoA thioesterase
MAVLRTRSRTGGSTRGVSFTGGIVIVVSAKPTSTSLPDQVLRPGLAARESLIVTSAYTALALRSGDVPVLATPRLLALCEQASCQAIDAALGRGRTSVATRVQFDHLAPVAIGRTVVAEASVARVEGRRVTFTLLATLDSDDCGIVVGAGRLTRVLVDEATFLAKAGADPCA